VRAAPCGVVRCVPVSVRVRVPQFAAPRRGHHNLYSTEIRCSNGFWPDMSCSSVAAGLTVALVTETPRSRYPLPTRRRGGSESPS